MGSLQGWDLSSIQFLWKSLQEFLCNPVHKPTNKQMDTGENMTSLAKALISFYCHLMKKKQQQQQKIQWSARLNQPII